MLLQEPVQAAIWDALNNYCYADAIFLAERLFAEISNNDSLHLLATCYYRSGKPYQAYMLLEKNLCQTAQCKYLMAKCCSDMNKFAEAERILAGTILTKVKSHEDIETEFGSLACYVFALLGFVYSKTERVLKASQCYRRSLALNPLLWKSYEMLCAMGENIKPETVFQIPPHSSSNTTNITTTSPQDTVTMSENISDTISTTIVSSENLLSPRNIFPNQTPENFQNQLGPHDISKAPRPNKQKPVVTPDPSFVRKRTGPTKLFSSSVHISPSFGLLPVENPLPVSASSTPSFISPVPTDSQALEVQAPIKTRPMTRRAQIRKSPVLNWSNTLKKMKEQEPVNAPIRRSSRLFTNSNSNSSAVKENNKSQTPGTYMGTKGVNRRSKKTTKTPQELNEINKGDLEVDTKPTLGNNETIEQIVQMQQQSLAGILHLLKNIGRAYSALARYQCKSAVDLFSELPEHQYNTGWVLCQVGRAYYELAEYQRAARVFEEVRRIEPYHIDGLDFYSSVLWHLHKEVELSLLAQELSAMDKLSAQAWFATGNCFSLQKEHDVAIKFFQRAIQVDPGFVYAYSLLALEYIYLEEFDKALTCFRNAIRLDTRHYQAWYGVGIIYYKQEKFSLAEVHYRKALSINPQSSVLMCHVGVAQHAQQKTDLALSTLNTAIKTDPKNPLCMFHRASILFANDRHKEALEELEILKQIIPRESLVYFLMGKVHKKLGNTHLAMMNFSWAMDLDPKGLNNQIKEAVDKRYVTEDDDPLARLEQDSVLDGEGAGALEGGELDAEDTSQDDASHMGIAVDLLDMPDLQAIESDESL
ncbi:cell division cycle protein 27 homolog [Physella acuta]|uniref:cell division cycle protein 27 homolog n=1 Tax=Physella acuta TaxID=109671 RepID=UPI0027DC82F3|nr:cell division cycle protein 27 homolog [Physella acuta]